MTSYTEKAIKDVMLAGVGDDDIRREVLSTEDILSRSSFDIISFIESKEMGRHATDIRGLYLQFLPFNVRRRDVSI